MLKQEDEQAAADKADEFVRNFFIKYGMKRTLDAFQVGSWAHSIARVV